jgi:ferredoxin-type protein NapH
MAKQPGDVRFVRGRGYQRARRLSLLLSFVFVVGVPVWRAHTLWASGKPLTIGAPFTVRVLGVEFLDPLAALGLLVARAGDRQLLWTALVVLILVALLGRFFCGWICPYVPILAVSNATRALVARFLFKPADRRWPRRTNLVILALTLALTAVSGLQLAPLVYPPSVIGREIGRALFFGTVGLGAAVIALAFLFDTFVSRAGFCRYLCPGGALFSLVGALSPLRIRRKPEACIDCALCDVVCNLGQQPMSDRLDAGCERCGKCIAVCPTDALLLQIRRPGKKTDDRRRNMLALALVGLAGSSGCSATARERTRLRPPGAASCDEFERRCIRCFRCAEVCPPMAIRFDSMVDLRAADVPFIDPQSRACILCMKCTEVCPTGALSPVDVDAEAVLARVRMGVPQLDPGRCIAWQKSGVCRMCYYACPYADRAIRLLGSMQAPRFDAAHCVGCGLCEEACPTRAHAIRILPFRGTRA